MYVDHALRDIPDIFVVFRKDCQMIVILDSHLGHLLDVLVLAKDVHIDGNQRCCFGLHTKINIAEVQQRHIAGHLLLRRIQLDFEIEFHIS